jgi:hypothetical protein
MCRTGDTEVEGGVEGDFAIDVDTGDTAEEGSRFVASIPDA